MKTQPLASSLSNPMSSQLVHLAVVFLPRFHLTVKVSPPHRRHDHLSARRLFSVEPKVLWYFGISLTPSMTMKIQRLRFKNGTKIRFKYLQIKIKAL
jgi:hypothetical protein